MNNTRFQKGHTPWHKGKKLPQLSGINSSRWNGGKILLNCLNCNKDFLVYPCEKERKFCSRECKHLNQRVEIVCQECKKTFVITKHMRDSRKRKFCSNKCFSLSNVGKKMPPRFGKKAARWNGGKTSDKAGYVYVHKSDNKFASKNGYMQEHLVVVEDAGFEIREKGQVHHINEIKSDNKLENLYLFESYSEHRRYHMNLRYNKCERIIKSNLV